MPNELVVLVEEGRLYLEKIEGNWLTPGQCKFLEDFFQEEVDTGLREDVERYKQKSIDKAVDFLLTFRDPSMIETPARWCLGGEWDSGDVILELGTLVGVTVIRD